MQIAPVAAVVPHVKNIYDVIFTQRNDAYFGDSDFEAGYCL